MSIRTHAFLSIAVAAVIATAACDRSANRDATVTTTSPAGESTAPSSAVAEERDEALVRVVHAIQSGAAVDIFADETTLFDGVEYKAVTPYRSVEGQRYELQLKPTGMTGAEALASNSEGLDDGSYYTVFVLPGDEDRDASLHVSNDRFDRPADGKAQLRVVHAAPGTGEIDIHVPGSDDAVVDGVNFRSVTSYHEIDPIRGTAVQVRTEGNDAAIATVTDAQVAAGRFYTLVVAGRGPTGRLEAFLIEDVLHPSTSTAGTNR